MKSNAWIPSPYRFPYRLQHPIKEISRIVRNFKFCYQRIVRGWCDADVWDLDMWFLELIPEMLYQLRLTTHTHPAFNGEIEMSMHDWKNVLFNMELMFREAADEENDDEDRLAFTKTGFDLFNEWFYNLWD